jgi:hypothetical protein
MPAVLSFLSPYIGRIIFVVVALAVGFGAGVKYEQPKIAKLKQTIGADQGAIRDLTAGVAAQNQAILDLQNAAKARAAKALKDVNDALALAADEHKRAAAILAKRPPKGVNVCTAAQAEFDAELKAERGIK